MKPFNNKGFTLIELIVTIVICSILMVALVSFTATILNVYTHTWVENDQQFMMSIIKEHMKNEFTLADDIESTGDSSFDKLSFQNNIILKNDTNAFSDDFYRGQSITGEVSGFGSLLDFNITITDTNGKSTTEEFTVKTFNKINIDITNPINTIFYKHG